jgi:NADH dehydrogenase
MTKQTILVAGSGFAGVWAVLAAARAIALAGREDHIDLIMVAPQPRLAIRPRFYEAVLDNMDPDVSELLKVVGARFVDGIVETIGADTRQAAILRGDGSRETIGWDRFVLATGSRVAMPPIPGLVEHAFTVDQLDQAQHLDAHIKALPARPQSAARHTVVVAGGGFTGLEAATELHERLRVMFAPQEPRVVIVDPAPEIGAEFGAEAGRTVREALAEIGIEQRPVCGSARLMRAARNCPMAAGSMRPRSSGPPGCALIRWPRRCRASMTPPGAWLAMLSCGRRRLRGFSSPAIPSRRRPTMRAIST